VTPGRSGAAAPAGLRVGWGLAGALAVAREADLVVVVDVLSFTTTVTVAVEAGMTVWPWRWGGGWDRRWDQDATDVARAHAATVAVGRSQARPGEVSLSPVSVAAAVGVRRVVLPSPNGGAISAELAARGFEVVAACLRNASAVARWVERSRPGSVVGLVAAGELEPSGGLRLAAEDHWGVGAVAAALRDLGRTDLSPEAEAAVAAYESVAGAVPHHLAACPSGQELVGSGYRGDVALAAEVDASTVVPRLSGGAFTAAG
jgi:2-phosphosulfolactate phosphatase